MNMKNILDFLLSDNAKEIADNFDKSSIKGAQVVGRGTVVVDGKEIASSKEFTALKAAASRIVKAENLRGAQRQG